MGTLPSAARFLLALATLLAFGGCATEIGDAVAAWDGSGIGLNGGSGANGRADAGPGFGNADGSYLHLSDAFFVDAKASVDAFFINDPPPPMCGPDGGMTAVVNPGGTPDCPDDKNREGCPCPTIGESAACWPGKRVNRNHGSCKDGVTTCNASDEFGQRWGPCEGFVLPKEGALTGADACSCLSDGTWRASNLVPCIYGVGADRYLYSSHLENGKPLCPTVNVVPPPLPVDNWSEATLNVGCAGKFTLCFQIKAGDVATPSVDDCVVTRQCVDVWYDTPGSDMALPALTPWISTDLACNQRFIDTGGYGETTVLGKSVECELVDDGAGQPFVFFRTNYCPVSCNDNPSAPGCAGCQTGGSGNF